MEHGADVNAQANDGSTPLCYAAAEPKRLDVLQYLIGQGADVNIRSADKTAALHYATVNTDIRAISTLIEAGADVCTSPRLEKLPVCMCALLMFVRIRM